jgi:hypothetical protein
MVESSKEEPGWVEEVEGALLLAIAFMSVVTWLVVLLRLLFA